MRWINTIGKNNTNFEVNSELWCTHFRIAYLKKLKHHNLNKIVVLDTVPTFPPLIDQLKDMDLTNKIKILPGAKYQIAAGIAFDYFYARKRCQ